MKFQHRFSLIVIGAAFLATSCQTLNESPATEEVAVDAPTITTPTRTDEPAIVETSAALASFKAASASSTAAAGVPTMFAHFIDVGQGACTLLEFPCGVVLVDTGSSDDPRIANTPNFHTEHLMKYLADFFDRRKDLKKTIDALIITHPHIDHTYGLPSVAAKYPIKHYVDDGIFKSGSGKKQVSDLRKLIVSKPLSTTVRAVTEDEFEHLSSPTGVTDKDIDSISCKDCDPVIRILTGGRPAADGSYGGPTKFSNPNDNSLVVRVDFGKASFLITGDLETPGIGVLLARYKGTKMLDTDVYLAGHHGSYNATTKPLVDAITPKIAVFPVGHWTDGPRFSKDVFDTMDFGHPRSSVVQMLASSVTTTRSPAINVQTFVGVRNTESYTVTKGLYATGWDGDVVITATLDGALSVRSTGWHAQNVQPGALPSNVALDSGR